MKATKNPRNLSIRGGNNLFRFRTPASTGSIRLRFNKNIPVSLVKVK